MPERYHGNAMYILVIGKNEDIIDPIRAKTAVPFWAQPAQILSITGDHSK